MTRCGQVDAGDRTRCDVVARQSLPGACNTHRLFSIVSKSNYFLSQLRHHVQLYTGSLCIIKNLEVTTVSWVLTTLPWSLNPMSVRPIPNRSPSRLRLHLSFPPSPFHPNFFSFQLLSPSICPQIPVPFPRTLEVQTFVKRIDLFSTYIHFTETGVRETMRLDHACIRSTVRLLQVEKALAATRQASISCR